MNTNELIICKSCGQSKPLAEYPYNPRAKSGHTSICRACYGKRISAGRSEKSAPPPQCGLQHSNPKFADVTSRELILSLRELINELKCRGYTYKGSLTYLQTIKL